MANFLANQSVLVVIQILVQVMFGMSVYKVGGFSMHATLFQKVKKITSIFLVSRFLVQQKNLIKIKGEKGTRLS